MIDNPGQEFGALNPEEEREFADLVADLGFNVPLAVPSPELKSKLMAVVRSTAQSPAPGIFVIPSAGGEWKRTPYPGVDFKPLYYDAETSMQTVILRLAAGARYPRHRHAKAEQCLVLKGQVEVASGVQISAGDFEWAVAGTDHDTVYSATGCELLIIASRHDEILA